MTIQLNTSFLNRTPNKTRRAAPVAQVFLVWHETGGYGSLNWNLKPDVRSSYNYLILRNGTIYHYVDEATHYAWHAGAHSRWTVAGALYRGPDINIHSVGIELEGMNNGQPITDAQRHAAAALARHLCARDAIPFTPEYHPAHSQVAPLDAEGDVYKTDPRGYRVADILVLAAPPARPADATVIGVSPSITIAQFRGALARNFAPINGPETERIFALCRDLEIDPAFLLALWAREGGRPLGSSELQQQTKCAINIKAAPGEWRPTAAHNGERWRSYESFHIGLLASVEHIKTVYGWQLRAHTVRAIITALAPASDGNDVERYIASVLEDMRYMREH